MERVETVFLYVVVKNCYILCNINYDLNMSKINELINFIKSLGTVEMWLVIAIAAILFLYIVYKVLGHVWVLVLLFIGFFAYILYSTGTWNFLSSLM